MLLCVVLGALIPSALGICSQSEGCATPKYPEGYCNTSGKCSLTETSSRPTPKTISLPIDMAVAEQVYLEPNITSVNCSNNTEKAVALNGTYQDISENVVILTDSGLELKVVDYDDLGQPIVCLNDSVDGIDNFTNVSFLECTSVFVSLNKSDYILLQNGSIQLNGLVINEIFYDNHKRLVICSDKIINSTYEINIHSIPGIKELTYIGCSLSVLGSSAVFVTYSIFPELRTFPGLILMNLCVAVAAINILYVTVLPVILFYPLKQICTTIAVLLHYFYLAQFSWMTIFSFETTKSFYQARKLIKSSKKAKCKFLILYMFLAWFVPLVIIGVSIFLNYTTSLVDYGENSHGEIDICWINHFYSYIVAFFVPLFLSLSFNFVFLIVISILLCRACKDQYKLGRSSTVNLVRVWVAIFFVTGLTWTFGFLALADGLSWMWYLFVIFNSAQGFSIFITFIFTKKIFKLYKDLMKRLFKSRHILGSTPRRQMV